MFKLSLIKLFKIVTLFSFLAIYHQTTAQEPRVIDNKGTLKNINKVTKNDTGSKPIVDVVGGDVYVDELNGEVYIFNGKTSTWTSFTQYWSLKGNTLSATNNNFLGTKNDVKLQLRSNNKSIIEFGKRSTLGLPIISGSYPDIPITYIKNGDSSFSTIQFQSGGTNSYGKPMIRASNNFFMIRSGIPNNDFFQISSAGSHPNGRLEFVIGDDGNEPFVFERQCNTCGGREELFRVQGSGNNSSSKTRFGINTAGTMANSTLQVVGSISRSVTTTTSNLTLTEEHHTVILEGSSSITLILPSPNACEGRIYIIRNSTENTTGGLNNPQITSIDYKDLENNNTNVIYDNSVLKIQSDGSEWIRINNTNNIKFTKPIKVVDWNQFNGANFSAAGYTVQEGDYTLIISNVRTAFNNARWLQLPNPVTSTGRIIIVKNVGPHFLYTRPNYVYTTAFYTFDNLIGQGDSVILQSDGNRWYKVN